MNPKGVAVGGRPDVLVFFYMRPIRSGCLLGVVLASFPSIAPGICGVSMGLTWEQQPGWSYDHGAIVRGDRSERRVALIFTGGEYGEGTEHILGTLKRADILASFFVTGAFIRQPRNVPLLKRMVAEGHYLGPHSDSHPLYCSWEDREVTLVSREFFHRDLEKNISDLRTLGALSTGAVVFFIPPYEWFNREQVQWAEERGVRLFNFTPGTGSNRDWAPPDHPSYAPSEQILKDILSYEGQDPDGLSGFLLLLHLGAQREDKVFLRLGTLIAELQAKGYSFVRIDEMLTDASG